jgi:hypothetical protein
MTGLFHPSLGSLRILGDKYKLQLITVAVFLWGGGAVLSSTTRTLGSWIRNSTVDKCYLTWEETRGGNP